MSIDDEDVVETHIWEQGYQTGFALAFFWLAFAEWARRCGERRDREPCMAYGCTSPSVGLAHVDAYEATIPVCGYHLKKYVSAVR